MSITLFNGKEKKEVKIDGKLFEIKPPLQNVYQNSEEIKNVKMEVSKYSLYGCRAVALFRMVNQTLIKKGIITKELSLVELDKILDSGGEFKDAWADNRNKPVYDIINGLKFIDKINEIYKTNLEYFIFRKKDYDINLKVNLHSFFFKDCALCVKMPNLVTKGMNHFVNVDGFVSDHITFDFYLKMKETYDGYNGYDGYFIDWRTPEYYELIL